MSIDYKANSGGIVIAGVFGEDGGIIIQNTSAATGDFNCLYPLVDSVISAATLVGFTGSLAGLTLTAGIPFYGRCTSVTLTSGKIIAYNRVVSVE
jgi:hypothetical protein